MLIEVKKSRARLLADTVPLCVFNRHSPDRPFVRWDGFNFIGECKHCGEHIRRKEHRMWLREWRDDADGYRPERLGDKLARTAGRSIPLDSGRAA